MEIFLDTANIQEIKNYSFIIDGVTTNPTLIAKEMSECSLEEHIKMIAGIVPGPISVEAVSNNSTDIINEAIRFAEISDNIVVKIPMTEEGLRATKVLNSKGIKTNVTLIFSSNQALLAAKAGATYASIFIGRLDDIGNEGMDTVRESLEIIKIYGYETKIITASIRHPMHVLDAAKAGSHVATIPSKVLGQMLEHPLTNIGIQKFMDDWKRYTSL